MATTEGVLLTTRRDGCAACGSRRYRSLPLTVSRAESWRELRECLRCMARYVRIFGAPRHPDTGTDPRSGAQDDGTPRKYRAIASERALDGVTLLLVDDDADEREILRTLFELAGATVATAGGAREGLKLVEAGRFDVLVTDLTMPHDDGYWLLDRVRAMLGEIPVVSISGVATHRTAVLGAGFDAFLRKPVEPDELVGVVALLSGRAAA